MTGAFTIDVCANTIVPSPSVPSPAKADYALECPLLGAELPSECLRRSVNQCPKMAGQRPPADRPNNLHLCLFRHFKCVIYLDAEVPDFTFKFRMPE